MKTPKDDKTFLNPWENCMMQQLKFNALFENGKYTAFYLEIDKQKKEGKKRIYTLHNECKFSPGLSTWIPHFIVITYCLR